MTTLLSNALDILYPKYNSRSRNRVTDRRITERRYENLSAFVPVEVNDIERLMAEPGLSDARLDERPWADCHPDGCEATEDVILMAAKQPEDLLFATTEASVDVPSERPRRPRR